MLSKCTEENQIPYKSEYQRHPGLRKSKRKLAVFFGQKLISFSFVITRDVKYIPYDWEGLRSRWIWQISRICKSTHSMPAMNDVDKNNDSKECSNMTG